MTFQRTFFTRMRNRLSLPVRNYSAEAESPAINWKTFNDNAKGVGLVFAGFSAVIGAFVYFVGNQVQHVERQVGIKIDHLDKKIDNIEIRMRENQKDIEIRMRENLKDIVSIMRENQKELMAVINPLVVKVQVLEERMRENLKDIESRMIDNQKELMAVINPLVVKVQVLEESVCITNGPVAGESAPGKLLTDVTFFGYGVMALYHESDQTLS
ncbi:hypothetical protein MP638_004196 [Amoeboaphelidium occidentale]|nr:hypothetical protein MP638_004196 [Amoeboaphelidium occidentale]